MKKLLFSLVSLLILCSCGKEDKKGPMQISGTVVESSISKYKLYKTQNMWTFLKLDTSSGLIWQVQYSVKEEEGYRFETPLNVEKLNNSNINGRYELYPTDNMFNYILLDAIDGKTYQVQWSPEVEKRFVIPIRE